MNCFGIERMQATEKTQTDMPQVENIAVVTKDSRFNYSDMMTREDEDGRTVAWHDT